MYETYYGLTSKPFQLSPDPRFFYASEHHKRAMLYMQYGLDQAEGFIVISGPVGTGKSILARNLIDQIAGTDLVACQIVTTNLNADDLIFSVVSGFGLTCNSHDKAHALKQLETFLLGLHRENKRALLLIDEAQNLPIESIEELRMLSNFQQGGKPLLQSFLLGQEELRTTLQSPEMEQFRQRIIASSHLTPLNLKETQSYIKHRLIQVGWLGNPAINTAAYSEIYECTQGVPRKINRLCDRVLLAAYLNESQHIDSQLVYQTAKELADEMSTSSPSAPVIDAAPTKTSTTVTVKEASAIDRLEQHLNAIYQYLDSSLENKLQMVRYLDRNIAKKTSQYRTLKKRLEKLESEIASKEVIAQNSTHTYPTDCKESAE